MLNSDMPRDANEINFAMRNLKPPTVFLGMFTLV